MKWLEALLNAPLYTLMLLCGCCLLILAFAEKLPWGIQFLVSPWRTISFGGSGAVLLLGGLILGVALLRVQSRATKPLQEPTTNAFPTPPPDDARRRPAANAPPDTTVVLYSDPLYADWDCERDRSAEATLTLPPTDEFTSGEIELMEVVAAKSYNLSTVVFDPSTRTAIGKASFRGLDKVFFNCPGGGHARFRLKVLARRRS